MSSTLNGVSGEATSSVNAPNGQPARSVSAHITTITEPQSEAKGRPRTGNMLGWAGTHKCRYVPVPGMAEFASVALLPTPDQEPHGKRQLRDDRGYRKHQLVSFVVPIARGENAGETIDEITD